MPPCLSCLPSHALFIFLLFHPSSFLSILLSSIHVHSWLYLSMPILFICPLPPRTSTLPVSTIYPTLVYLFLSFFCLFMYILFLYPLHILFLVISSSFRAFHFYYLSFSHVSIPVFLLSIYVYSLPLSFICSLPLYILVLPCSLFPLSILSFLLYPLPLSRSILFS